MDFTITVNGAARDVSAEDDRTLLDVLREDLGVTGPKFGCGEGECGACVVLVGRRAVPSCQTRAVEVAGQRVTTVEGLAEDGVLHPVQQAWLETGAMQCGYCTPGWLTETAALLVTHPHPSDDQIDAALGNHVCRCCTYPRIRRAVHRAAELMEEPESLVPVPPRPEPAAGPDAGGPPDPPGAPGPVPSLDLSAKDDDSFFAALSDGLVTVAAADDDPAAPVMRTSADAWVHVGADGRVTAYTGKVEGGQGTRTALAALVAEELAVPVESVRVVMGDTGLSPYDRGTFGSRSMPDAAPRLLEAAATAREVLRAAAASRFGMNAADLTTADQMVAGPDGAPLISYADLLHGVRRVERTGPDAPVTARPDWRRAGQPTRALGSGGVVTGVKCFPSDVTRPGMLHGCVLRPPSYGAELRRADVARAAAVPGATVVGEDGFTGVVAGRAADARRAVEMIDAEWDERPQPARAGLEPYLRAHPVAGEGWSRPFRREEGDVDAALAAAPSRFEATYTVPYIAHVPLEPRVAVAEWHDGRVTVWVGTSTPFATRQGLAEALGLAEADVRVVVPDYGGGFGGKHGAVVAIEAARLARAAGRPVKVAWTRAEEFTWGYLRPAAVIDVASGAEADGTVTAWSFVNINSGQVGIVSPYRVPHQRFVYQPADSPLPQGSYRALAATANNFARESHLDEMARRFGADPVEFRLRHLADDRLAAVLRAVAARAGGQAREDGTGDGGPARGRARDGERVGLGIACGTEKGSYVATAARVAVDGDGRLRLLGIVTGFECGTIVNPDNLTNQVQGATVMDLGGALFEEIDFADGRLLNASLSQYRVPRLPDVPDVEVILLDRQDLPSAGGGETPIIAIAPALANAIRDATGQRLRSLPLAPRGVIRQSGN